MDNLSKSLSNTIADSNLEVVNQELEDVLLDTSEAILDESMTFLDEIPILRSLRTIPKIYTGISNYLLTKKIIRFLTQIQTVSAEERRAFLEGMDKEKSEEMIESLMLILEKHDDYKKSEIQGRVFKALIKKDIDTTEYNTLTYVVGMINLSTTERLINFYRNVKPGYSPEMTSELLYYFSFLQLIKINDSSIGTFGGGGPVFEHNKLGEKFVEILSSTNPAKRPNK